mmetsp:Transcript_35861/g.89482  ORF Transcript_35861/g.89482 Transcript_35861/m.89482 type:complete len:228 (+) Transcript_35861:1390-2073(+)
MTNPNSCPLSSSKRFAAAPPRDSLRSRGGAPFPPNPLATGRRIAAAAETSITFFVSRFAAVPDARARSKAEGAPPDARATALARNLHSAFSSSSGSAKRTNVPAKLIFSRERPSRPRTSGGCAKASRRPSRVIRAHLCFHAFMRRPRLSNRPECMIPSARETFASCDGVEESTDALTALHPLRRGTSGEALPTRRARPPTESESATPPGLELRVNSEWTAPESKSRA